MNLQKLIISNFRCYGKEPTVIEFDEITGLIGHNSSGKTALIVALMRMFGDKVSERSVVRGDFHIPSNVKLEDVTQNDLYIEAFFSFESLEAYTEDSNDVPIYFKHLVVAESGGKPFIRIRLEATWEKNFSLDGIIDSEIYFVHTNLDQIDESKKIKATRRLLEPIKLIYIPAIRQPHEQLKNVSGTIMYRLLNSIKWSDEVKDNVKTKTEEVEEIFAQQEAVQILALSLQSQWQSYHKDKRYSNTSINFSATELDTILKRVEVSFSPSELPRNYKIEELGDGLRSLFYLSLVDTMLDIEQQIIGEIKEKAESKNFDLELPAITILAMEEPENHISPQLLGRVMEKLKNISDKLNSQIIVTSHSPSIVKRVDPVSIRHFRICPDKDCTQVNKLSLPEETAEICKYVKEAIIAYPELYFAKVVILGEGDSEQIIIPKMLELKGVSIDSSEVSIVPLGGRHVNHFWKLLNKLDIPHITLLDLDRERAGGGWGRIKYVLKQLLENGYDKNVVLKIGESVLGDDELETMHTKELENQEDVDVLNLWISHLECYGLYFSSPLDIDFSMLTTFKDKYINILKENEGPRVAGFGTIRNPEKNKEGFQDAIDLKRKKAIGATLKEEGGDGKTFTNEEKELMIWYTYFFLNRGKPTTHRELFATNENIKYEDFPQCLRKFVDSIEKKIK